MTPGARLRAVQGEVLLFGENIYHKEVEPVLIRRRVGMVFQKSIHFPRCQSPKMSRSVSGSMECAIGLWLGERMIHALVMAALWDESKESALRRLPQPSGGSSTAMHSRAALAVQPKCAYG